MTNDEIVGYVLLRISRWDKTRAVAPGTEPDGILLGAPPGQMGFLPVYATLEALVADCGEGAPWVAIRQAEEAGR